MGRQQTDMSDFNDFRRRAMQYPMLSKERELELVQRMHTDSQACDEIVQAHLRMVASEAWKYRSYNLPLLDVNQAGMVGLMEAAKRFDAARGVRFSTYAGWWIRAFIQDFSLKNLSIVKAGVAMKQKRLFFNLRRKEQHFDGSGLTKHEIDLRLMQEFGVSLEDVQRVRAMRSGDFSLNRPLNQEDDEASEAIDMLPDESEDQESALSRDAEREARHALLQEALATLSDRSRRIFVARRLTEKEDGIATLETLGAEFGVSRERIRQLEDRAFELVQRFILAGGNAVPRAPRKYKKRRTKTMEDA